MGTISQTEYNRLIGKDESKKSSGSLVETLSQENNFKVISDYMTDRFGMTTAEYDKKEIIDSYVDNMRKFNFGQSLVTVGELAYLNKGEGNSLEKRRKMAGNAYSLFDSMDGAFSKNRTAGEKLDAVRDYARALIVDPVNVLSLGVGKLVTAGATKAATALAKKAAIEAAEAATKTLGKKAGTKKGQEKIAQEARKEYTKRIVGDSAYKQASNKAVRKEIVATAAIDSAAGVGVEAMGQKARIKTEVQTEYDPLALFLSAAGGMAGGGLSFALNKSKGTSKLPLYSTLINRSEQITLASRKEAMDEAARVFDAAKAVDELDVKVVQEDTVKLSSFADQWAERIAEGLELKIANKEMGQETYDAAFDYGLIHYFYMGDKEGVKGLQDILYDAGVQRWKSRGEKDTFNLYLGDIYKELDSVTKQNIQKSYDSVFDNAIDKEFKGMSVENFLKRMSKDTSDGARTMSLSRHLNADLNGSIKDLTNKQIVDTILDPVKTGAWEKTKEFSTDFQKNFIKYLVMHPGTTALNIKGWLQASTMQSTSDMIQAALYGGAGIMKDIVGDKSTAVAYRNKSKQLVKLQVQKFKNIVDPYMTYEAAMDYLTFRPEARTELFRYIYGGVEVDNVLKELKLNPGEKLSETKFQKLTDTLQTLYGVKVQDFLSKTQEFMYSLDKQVRLEYDMSLGDFMDQDNVWEYLSDPASDSYKKFLDIETTAVTDALDNSFSRSFTDEAQVRRGDPVAMIAKAIEGIRTIPIIGAVAPFGQFFNNTLAFTARHTGITMLYRGVIGKDQNLMEGVSRAAAGYVGLAAATKSEMSNLEDGLAWHEERQSDGQVVSRQYDFPYSHFKITARIFAHMLRDGKAPDELKKIFREQVLLEGFTRNIGDQGKIISDLAGSILDMEGQAAGDHMMKLLGSAFSMYGSGFTRFADPLNQTIAMTKGEDYIYSDKKQGSKAWNDTLRYTDQIFGKLLGTSQVEKKIATQEDSPAVPIGRLVGFRAVEAPTTIEKIFNDVGRPQWKTNLYSTPEAANIINDYIFPYLEMWADTMVANNWDERTLKEKESLLTSAITAAKNDVKEVLKVSQKDEPKKAGLIYEITESNVDKEKLKSYLEAFGTSEDKLWELDPPQLQLIISFLEDESFRKNILKTRTGLK